MKLTPYLQAIKNKKITEGLSPIYRNGVITPGTKGLGPDKMGKPIKVAPEKKTVPKKPLRRINIKNLA